MAISAPTSDRLPGREYPTNQVNVGGGGSSSPYINTQGSKVFGPGTVRATGDSKQGDAAWRQNLATFSGGQFARPGGSLNFNPLDSNPFGGAPTGGGSAPVLGMPSTLLQQALGGQPFTFTPPQSPSQSPTPSGQSTINSNDDWLTRFMSQGANFGYPT